MYLSRIKLDTNKRSTQMGMSSLNKFHGAIEEAFDYQSGGRDRKLWRLDRFDGNTYLLLLSRDIPRFEGLVDQFGTSQQDCIAKKYDTLINRVEKESYWRFRLVANPTICKTTEKDKRGKRIAVVSSWLQKEWLIKQADKNGFQLNDSMFEIKESKWITFRKRGGHLIKAVSVTYEGILQVKDVDKFQNALVQGIGREKAYGMGLLTIMK